ncbi:hypothetical protein [Gordonia humi]|uniref:Putative membrane protein n=1 Tax=Gordonia humi TaxID=686429 RepID=A0A840F7Z8_9ACTN|nr:hypothetical protein [Gordonia humi]MBB4135637.1 putative membrane protein [Gordonia humi]
MQSSRLFPFATIVAAATAIALTALPWMSLRPVGFDVSWNGLGMGGLAGVDDFAPAGRGWLVIAASIVAILAALISLMPAVQAQPVARLANAAAAVVCVLGAFVPVAVMIWPGWYSNNVLDQVGLVPFGTELGPSKAVLIPLTVVMLLTAALCAYSATDRGREERDVWSPLT